MNYSSIGTSFSHNIGMEGEFVDFRPIGCLCRQCSLSIKKSVGLLGVASAFRFFVFFCSCKTF